MKYRDVLAQNMHETSGKPLNEVYRNQAVCIEALDFERNIPTLHCEVTESGTQVKFRCGYCNCYHYHGNVPKDSPDKGHRVAHCYVDPEPYPNGYYLRTDLDKIYRQRYPNFIVRFVRSSGQDLNAHYRKCERLELPSVAIWKERNYAMVDVDFLTTTNYCMDGVLGTMLSTVGVEYRRRHQHRAKSKWLGYPGVDTREFRRCTRFWIFVNDAYILADVLMPIINDRTHWKHWKRT